MRRTVAALAVLLPLLIMTACASPRTQLQRVAGTARNGRQAVGAHGVAVGGVVLADGLSPATPLGDDADNAALLHALLQAALPEAPLMPRPIVEDLAGSVAVAAILDDCAHSGQVDAAGLRRLGADLRGPRRLALVRVERDELFFRAGSLGDLGERSAQAGFAPHGVSDAGKADNWAMSAIGDVGKRSLTATLYILDLDTGGVLWALQATAHDKFRRTPAAPQHTTALRLAAGDSAAPPVRYERLPGSEVPSDGKALLSRCLETLVGSLGSASGLDRGPSKAAAATDPIR